jgi:hypothetical protein
LPQSGRSGHSADSGSGDGNGKFFHGYLRYPLKPKTRVIQKRRLFVAPASRRQFF